MTEKQFQQLMQKVAGKPLAYFQQKTFSTKPRERVLSSSLVNSN